jgi:hypothetical protein
MPLGPWPEAILDLVRKRVEVGFADEVPPVIGFRTQALQLSAF